MKRWGLVAAVVVLALTATTVYRAHAGASMPRANCHDWAEATAERVATARQLLYPPERQEESTGSLQGDAQALLGLAQEQSQSDAPDEAFNLSGDLVEAFAAGAAALGGGGGAAPDAQIAFAKAIVYNADLRLGILMEGC